MGKNPPSTAFRKARRKHGGERTAAFNFGAACISKAACTLKADKLSRSSQNETTLNRSEPGRGLRPIEFQFADTARRTGGDCDAYDTDIVIDREREFEDS